MSSAPVLSGLLLLQLSLTLVKLNSVDEAWRLVREMNGKEHDNGQPLQVKWLP